MSVAMFPQVVWSISLDNLREICPDAVAAVEALDVEWGTIAKWKEQGGGLDEYIWNFMDEDREVDADLGDRVEQALESLKRVFEAKTGLGLILTAYDPDDDGGPGDDVDYTDGCVFEVTGVQQFTPAGERLRDKIRESRWTIVA